MYPGTIERRKTSHDPYEHPDPLTSFVIALNEQIIENGALHSVRIILLVSLHLLLPVSKWM